MIATDALQYWWNHDVYILVPSAPVGEISENALNDLFGTLLDATQAERVHLGREWHRSFDVSSALWEALHPGTRAPAFKVQGPPPSCFTGVIPPLYEDSLSDEPIASPFFEKASAIVRTRTEVRRT